MRDDDGVPNGTPSLRVALVLPESTGGIGRHVRMLAADLVRRGHQVTVVGPTATLDRFAFEATGARTESLPVGAARGVLVRRRRLRLALSGHDVVHAHGVRTGAEVAFTGARPLVVTWHNAPIGGRLRAWTHALLERASARGSDVVLVASQDLADRAHRAGAPRILFCPVAAPALTAQAGAPRRGRQDSRPLLLAVARLHPQKRLDLLIDATAGWVRRPSCPQVLVVGDGPLRRRLERHASRVASPVELVGARDDVSALLAEATAVVLPSDWEARPLIAQEALRAGVPLVATAVGGVPDLVGEAAVLVPPGDADALGRALERVLDDADLRDRLAAAGPRQVASWLSEDDMVTLVATTYLEVRSSMRLTAD